MSVDDEDERPWTEDIPHPAAQVYALPTPPQVSPPHSLEAERECLAAALLDAGALTTMAQALAPEDFFADRHRLLYEAMLDLRDRAVPVDPVTLRQRLVDRGTYARVGEARAIGELLDRAGTIGNVGHYVDTVRRKAAARALIAAAQRIEAAGLQGGDDELESYMAESAQALRQASDRFRARDGLRITDWSASKRYQGDARPVEWLVPDMIARSEPSLLAAPGETGKGFLTLSLALQLSSGMYATGRRAPFGKAILPSREPVACVMLYGEDAEDPIHRRLDAIDPDHRMREAAGDRFIAVPMPSAGGSLSVLERTPEGTFRPTTAWLGVVEQLGEIPNLGLVSADPLASFLSLDVDAESTVSAALGAEMTRVAEVLNAAFLVAHHMKKSGDDAKSPTRPVLPTHDGVRAAIRGTAALLNAMRMAYGIVPLPPQYAKAVLKRLNEHGEFDVARVYWGAVVKANGRLDRRARLYVRAEYGLLEDRTSDIAVSGRLDDALKGLVSA